MGNKLISVISTVKNGEKTLEQTILSVLNQTYDNWEYVIVDDGSSDSTKLILNKYSRQDKRIVPIFTDGIGRGRALNLAVENSNGDFIANIDADDIMSPKRLKIEYELFKKFKDIFLVCSDSIIINENESVNWEKQKTEKEEIKIISDTLLIKNQVSHSSAMMNKKELIELGCYNQSRKSQYDYELWLRALANNKKMLKTSNNLVGKRIHSNQSFENKKRIKYLLRSQLLQLKYAFKIRRKVLIVLCITPVRIILGLLPFQVRKKISSSIGSKLR